MLDEDGKKRKLHATLQRIIHQPQLTLSLFFPLTNGERECRPHSKQEKRKDQIHPRQPRQFGIEGMCGWRCLSMVHPCGQNTARNGGRKHHRQNSISTKGIQRVGTSFHRQAPPSLMPSSTSFQRFLLMICTMSNTIRPSESFRFMAIVFDSLAGLS